MRHNVLVRGSGACHHVAVVSQLASWSDTTYLTRDRDVATISASGHHFDLTKGRIPQNNIRVHFFYTQSHYVLEKKTDGYSLLIAEKK